MCFTRPLVSLRTPHRHGRGPNVIVRLRVPPLVYCLIQRQPGFEGPALIEYEILRTKIDKLPAKPYPSQVVWLHGLIVRVAARAVLCFSKHLHLRLLPAVRVFVNSPNAPSDSGFRKLSDCSQQLGFS